MGALAKDPVLHLLCNIEGHGQLHEVVELANDDAGAVIDVTLCPSRLRAGRRRFELKSRRGTIGTSCLWSGV